MFNRFKRETLNNDVALIRLASPINSWTSHVAPVCLSHSAHPPAVGQKALVVGWGATKNNGPTVNLQRQVSVRIVQRDGCRKSYARDGVSVTENMICATAPHKDSCAGDSGGPLMVRRRSGHFEQVGIVSFGKSCALRRFPGIYTNLGKYVSWIEENATGGLARC